MPPNQQRQSTEASMSDRTYDKYVVKLVNAIDL